ncbi:MAG: glycosyltransferase [Gammaproteobacteria bacterium]|nr:glycosyltransferase [Gammaproteobacteria bacterium]
MRIAVFTDNFYPEIGGMQDSIRTTVRELGLRGHKVMVFAPAAATRDYQRANLQVGEPELGENVVIKRQFSIPVPSSSQQSRMVVPLGQSWREFAAFRPEVVHVHSFLGVGIEGLWAARRFGIPLVGTNHWAIGAFHMYAPVARKAFRYVSSNAVTGFYQRCDFVTGPSHFTLEDMRATGLNKPCRVISNPVDTRIFHRLPDTARRRLKARLGLGNCTVIYAGRLAPEKNIDLLLTAVAEASCALPEITLVLAGHGSHREKLQATACTLGIQRRVFFVGTLSQKQLAEFFCAADLFAISSTTETQSMVLLQAMACGLPAVGVRCGGLTEHIPAYAGSLSEPGDTRGLSTNMRKILSAPGLREKMGRQAGTFAENFSTASTTDAWEDAYADLVNDRLTSQSPALTIS